MSDLKVAFLPEWFNNPYQVQLREHLTRAGVQMVSLGRTPLRIVRGLIRERPDILHLHWLHAEIERLGKATRQGADVIVRPIFMLGAAKAALKAAGSLIISIFQLD